VLRARDITESVLFYRQLPGLRLVKVERRPLLCSITGPLIVAELGDLRRFASGRPLHALLAYAGMDPRIRQSGQWSGKIKTSKRGSVALRTALFQAASMARLHESRLAEIYHRHRHQMHKHHNVAISHVARKLLAHHLSVYVANLLTPQKYALSQLDSLLLV